MNTHDKFCPHFGIIIDGECFYCTALARARADEREQVLAAMHKRIVREEPQPHHGGDPESWSKGYRFGSREMLDAAAARGEDTTNADA